MKRFKMIHHADQATISEMYEGYAPVFVLSTGRSGSKFIVELLNLSPTIAAFHEPRPCLQYFSNFAFQHQPQLEILSRMIDAARMEMILETHIKNKIYVESNQCLTFFAPAIAGLFRGAKFAHLLRHPAHFVRSAVRKGWHRNDSIWESGRVRLADEKNWSRMEQRERLAWLWTVTNEYIETFKKGLASERSLTVRFEDLLHGPNEAERLFRFVGSRPINREQIRQAQDKRINELEIFPDEPPTMRKISDFPPYEEWPEEWQEKLRAGVGTLAANYGYEV